MTFSRTYPDFPLADSLGDGRFVPVEHYWGAGSDQLFFGRSSTEPGVRYLISTTTDNGLQKELLQASFERTSDGVFVTEFLGHYDADGRDDGRDRFRRQQCALVERVPDGVPVAKASIDLRAASAILGLHAGRMVQRAIANEVDVLGLRPEYVWVRVGQAGPAVTGIGGRNAAFFASARRMRDLPTAPLFEQRYLAPEVYSRGAYDDRAYVLTLSVMIAEWATGAYPYAIDDGAWGYNNLAQGDHLPLGIPAPLAELLSAGMRPDPRDRPRLDAFVAALERETSGAT